MSWTAKQIADLDGSMVAAQNVSLGTVVNALIGTTGSLIAVAGGTLDPTTGSSVVVTGLATVTYATVSLSGSPLLTHMWSTAIAGSVAGTLIIQSFKPTNASTVTAIPATAPFAPVNWIALGT